LKQIPLKGLIKILVLIIFGFKMIPQRGAKTYSVGLNGIY